MTVITCGVTYLDHRAEAYVKGLRESQGFVTGGGCAREINLDNPLQAALIYRCLECARFLCKPCIIAHFEETNDAYQPSTADSDRQRDGRTESTTRGGQCHVTAPSKPGHQERRGIDSPAGVVGTGQTGRPAASPSTDSKARAAER